MNHRFFYSQHLYCFLFSYIPQKKKKNIRISAVSLDFRHASHKIFLARYQLILCDEIGSPAANINFSLKFLYFTLSSSFKVNKRIQ